jgi:zinc and cadmium transporter
VFLAFAIFLLAACSAAAGVYLTSWGAFSRKLVPFGGGVLMGVALFWLLPEMAEVLGWPAAAAWTGGGAATLWLIDRFVYPVCPACAPAHDHTHCETRLHGFALPLLVAAALHSALDGWAVVAVKNHPNLGIALLFGIAAHKAPEGLALGIIARASMATRFSALSWCIIAEAATLLGAGLEVVFAPYLGTAVLHALLALAGGSFLYLGGHAVHGELRRSGAGRAFVPALTGVAGSSVLRLFVR